MRAESSVFGAYIPFPFTVNAILQKPKVVSGASVAKTQGCFHAPCCKNPRLMEFSRLREFWIYDLRFTKTETEGLRGFWICKIPRAGRPLAGWGIYSRPRGGESEFRLTAREFPGGSRERISLRGSERISRLLCRRREIGGEHSWNLTQLRYTLQHFTMHDEMQKRRGRFLKKITYNSPYTVNQPDTSKR